MFALDHDIFDQTLRTAPEVILGRWCDVAIDTILPSFSVQKQVSGYVGISAKRTAPFAPEFISEIGGGQRADKSLASMHKKSRR